MRKRKLSEDRSRNSFLGAKFNSLRFYLSRNNYKKVKYRYNTRAGFEILSISCRFANPFKNRNMNCVERFNKLRSSIQNTIEIVAVSKTKPATSIDELRTQTGHLVFGENKAQELFEKHKVLPSDIKWHFIGHLQTNKIKLIAPYVSMIQSVDSFRLLREINKEALKNNRVISCLLQFHIAKEEAKYGFSIEEAFDMLNDQSFYDLSNVKICGVMGMATFTNDKHQIKSEFKSLLGYSNTLKSKYFSGQPSFCDISMGMSDDYQIAIDEGSTIVRIGSGIFGGR